GRRVKGTMTQLSRSSLQLAPLTNEESEVPRNFEEASIRKIELASSRNILFTVIGEAGGLILGFFWSFSLAFGGSAVHPFVPLLGATTAGAFVGYLADRQRTWDVYQAP